MNGNELIKKIKKLGKQKGVAVWFDTAMGKGSHGTLYYGTARTTIKDRKKEIAIGLLIAMLNQLGISKEEIK